MQISLNLLVLIGICLLAMFFGYFFGLFEGRGQGYKKRRQEEAQEIKPEPIIAAPPKDNSLLKLSIDHNNQVQLNLDGQRMDTTNLAPEQRKRLIDLMVTMRPWIDASAPKPSAPPTPIASQPLPAAPVAAPVSQPVSKPVTPVSTSKKKEEAAAPTSMVGQIDAILQVHLAASPLANRGIRLAESPEGGVIVWDGINKYNGVGEVPDPQVQAMIRAAISEWENKYTPGG